MLKKHKSNLLYFLLLFNMLNYSLFGQIGGNSIFSFLKLSPSARTTALGGVHISTLDNDIAFSAQNPSLLNSGTDKSFSLNHNLHLADISYGFMAYGIGLNKLGIHAAVGLNYVLYGDFVSTDVFGNRLGQFSSQNLGLYLSASKALDPRISIGLSLKLLQASYESYSSYGVAFDIGITYHNEEKLTTTSLTLRNVGLQLNPLYNNGEKLPIEVHFGLTKRLRHVPLRFTFTFHDLQKWNLRSDDFESGESVFGNTETNNSFVSDLISNFFYHSIFATEFLLGKNENVNIRFSYNHQLKKDLQVAPFRSLNGFAFGFGLRFKKFAFDYSFGSYHLGQGANHLSVRINFNKERL